MKNLWRYESILTVIILVFSLSACAKTEQKGMYIKPSEFTEETREVLGLFDDEVQFFDIVLDETENSYELYSMDESGHVKYTYPELNTSFDESMAIIGSETSSMENYNVTEDFRTMDCNAGVVITLTVSDEIME